MFREGISKVFNALVGTVVASATAVETTASAANKYAEALETSGQYVSDRMREFNELESIKAGHKYQQALAELQELQEAQTSDLSLTDLVK